MLDVGYATAGLILSPWLIYKASTDPVFRNGFGERLGGLPPRAGERPCLWIHCASVGEVTLAKPLVEELRTRRPDLDFQFTTTTPAGRELARKTWPQDRVHHFPLDLTFCVRRALRAARPDAVVLVELEVWPNFIRIAEKRTIPVGIVNGRISHRSHRRYRRFIAYFRSIFRRVSKAGMQTREYADRARELGIPGSRVHITGNLKFDARFDFDPLATSLEVRDAFGLQPEHPLLVAGSTHDPEEKILVETYRRILQTYPKLRLMIAPRHVERTPEVRKIVEDAGFAVALRSELKEPPPNDRVLILDTVGELAQIYSAADAVFIGGTFCERGGQNMLEPAALGKPIVSGPSLDNFREIADSLVAAGAMKVVDNPIDLGMAVGSLVKEPAMAAKAGLKGKDVVESGRGSLKATADLVCGLLPDRKDAPPAI
ncbi:MAG TPA: 3-deoxy-D-manno-octulosonic acid transferase [Candidatus Eisenbacteria bacterium]|nr:3-deoxy-D-manno-octulosonic acid transferase [Candidatus Eisenbacteria bacterium]